MAKLALAAGLATAGLFAGLAFGPGAAFIGAEIGFSLGGIVGSMLFPGKLPNGPRLNDLQVSSATNGAPIPFGYGTVRVAGNMIWGPGIVEHQVTSGGGLAGKGGQPQQTNYNYTSSFAVAFGEGPAKFGRIWFDSKIAYDPNDNYVGVSAINGYQNSGVNVVTKTPSGLIVGDQVTLVGTQIQGDANNITTLDQVTNVVAVISPTLLVIKNQLSGFGGGGTVVAFGTLGLTSSGGTAITQISMAGDLVTVTCGLNPEPGSQVMIIDVGQPGPPPPGVPRSQYTYDGSFTVVSSAPTYFTYYNPPYTLPQVGPVVGGWVGWAVPAQPQYAPPTFYFGTETQGADPTIQAEESAAFTPAFRPLAYCVWQNLPLANFGNRLPNVRAEMTYQTDPIIALGWGDFNQQQLQRGGGFLSPASEVKFGFTPYVTGNIALLGLTRQQGQLADGWVSLWVSGDGERAIFCKSCSNANTVAEDCGSAGANQAWAANWLLFAGSGAFLSAAVTGVSISSNVLTVACQNSWIAGTIVNLSGFPTLSGSAFLNNQSVTVISSSGTSFTSAFTHSNFTGTDAGSALNVPYLQQYATDYTPVFTPTPTPQVISFPNPVKAGSTLVAIAIASDNNASCYIGTLDGSAAVTDNQGNMWSSFGDPAGSPSGAPCSIAYTTNAVAGSTTLTIHGVGSGHPSSEIVIMELPGLPAPASTSSLQYMVSDICQRSGLSASQIDVSALASVDTGASLGYPVGRPSSAQDILKPLAQAFFFDGVETSGVIRFVPRGGAVASLTVPESDLGLVKDNYKVTESISQIQNLPKEIKVLFMDPALNYQQNYQLKQRAARIVVTQNQNIVELPLTITADTARQIAEKTLYLSYLERHPFAFNLWKALYMLLDPTDVVNVTYEGNVYTLRLVRTSIGVDYKMEIESVSDNATAYTSTVVGSSGLGPATVEQHVVSIPSTVLFLLDVPLLRDADANPGGSGFYIAVSSPDVVDWTGASIQESSNNVDFSQLDTANTACTYGIATTVLPAPRSPWSWDTINSVTIRMLQGSLFGTSQLNVLNGANAVLLGSEIIQFQNAVQNADGSYTISGLLRGRRGTEQYCGTHALGDTAILLPAGGVNREDVSIAEVQVLRYFRPITFGSDITSVTSQLFTNTGTDLKPYAPVEPVGSRDGSSNVTLEWTRRTRIGGDWLDGIGEVPLSETYESYDVEIVNSMGAVVRTFSGIPLPIVVYTAAQQIADFGSLQTSVKFNVYQNSAQIGRGSVLTAKV